MSVLLMHWRLLRERNLALTQRALTILLELPTLQWPSTLNTNQNSPSFNLETLSSLNYSWEVEKTLTHVLKALSNRPCHFTNVAHFRYRSYTNISECFCLLWKPSFTALSITSCATYTDVRAGREIASLMQVNSYPAPISFPQNLTKQVFMAVLHVLT